MELQLVNPLANGVFPAKSVTYTGTAGSTGTWSKGAHCVLVWSDHACYVVVGEDVTATTSDTPIPANIPIPFIVPDNVTSSWRVSAIQVSTGGTVYCKPLGRQ